MGIKGLETFVDSIYSEENGARNAFDRVPLSNLKLVIDGNQLPYAFFQIHRLGHYGGNYDTLFDESWPG